MVKMLDGIGKIVEGYNSVAAALENHRVEEIHIKERNLQSKKVRDLFELTNHKKINIKVIKESKNWEFKSTEYIGAHCKPKKIFKDSELNRFSKSNFIVCDHVQDTNNLGAIARSAASFDFNVMCIPERRSARLNERTFKISSGGLEKIDIIEYKSIFTLIKKFQSIDIWTIGLDMKGAHSVANFDVGNQFLAFFIGSEENGLSNEIQNKLDDVLKIPTSNKIESLNVSVAAAIAMQHIFIKN
ncbi:RNA methyltransferase [Acidimicrobiaceae bacterium]|nr:RNA methyltransferase [Acidimicrobiaceae bacterium]